MSKRPIGIVFRIAAGPRCGFGHLMRCRSLAQALGVEPLASVRGTRATRRVASALGWTVAEVQSDTELRAIAPSLVVVDDPSMTAVDVWVRRARRVGVPVATIHDLGRGYAKSDLIVDGSIRTGARRRGIDALLGPEFAVLHPGFAAVTRTRPAPKRVLVALGGGVHVRSLASRLCLEIAARVPDVDLRVARGFLSEAGLPVLPAGRWVSAPSGLAAELSRAQVAVVAGGITLYEACALGVPVVALAVTPAQHLTIRAVAARGAAIDGGKPSALRRAQGRPERSRGTATPRRLSRVADAVASLLHDHDQRHDLSTAAHRLVDGRGAFRVARALRSLIDQVNPRLPDAAREARHAA